MTVTYIDNRIAELQRVSDSLLAELQDRDSKGYPGDEAHQHHVHEALFDIERAIADLTRAKEGAYRAE